MLTPSTEADFHGVGACEKWMQDYKTGKIIKIPVMHIPDAIGLFRTLV